MPIPAPHTWVAGDDATAANLQSLTDAIAWMTGIGGGASGKRPVVAAWLNTAVPVGSGVSTTIKMDTKLEDTDNALSTSTGLYTAITPGFWVFLTSLAWASNSTGVRNAGLLSTGSLTTGSGPVVPGNDGVGTNSGRSQALLATRLAVGQTVNVTGYQSSGGSLNTASGNGAVWLAGVLLNI